LLLYVNRFSVQFSDNHINKEMTNQNHKPWPENGFQSKSKVTGSDLKHDL